MTLAPIVLFVYNRLWHTRQTVEALRNNELAAGSDLFVFSDGPRSEADRAKVLEVRSYARTITGFNKVTLIERGENLGLARSIISGVTEIVNSYGRIIVLEDDMVTSPYFLKYMNEALELYRDEERVVSIHGYVYPVKTELPETFFIRGADCWGWATWRRGWEIFEADGAKLLAELKRRKLTEAFDFNGAYSYTKMLADQIKGNNDSWAIRWHASAFLRDKLTLYPGKSLIHNIGLDASGTHCDPSRVFDTQVSSAPLDITSIPVEQSRKAFLAFETYFRSIRTSFITRAWRKALKLGLKGTSEKDN